MEYWEFLIQKEGERSWVSLEAPGVEIQEGRYRVVIHSNRPNTNVEIRITHESTGEVPPKRRSQKRTRCTNSEGLMVLIPFTYLKPGYWELRCCGDLMSDFLGNTWQRTIKFQVLSNAVETPAEVEEATEQSSSAGIQTADEPTEQTASSTPPEAEGSAEQPLSLPASKTPEVITPLATEASFAEAESSQPSIPLTALEPLSDSKAELGEVASSQLPLRSGQWYHPQHQTTEGYGVNDRSFSESIQENFFPETQYEAFFNNEQSESLLDQASPQAIVPEPLTSPALFTLQPSEAVPVSHLVENSLQMVDEIIEEVVEPVWQDFQPIPKVEASFTVEPRTSAQKSTAAYGQVVANEVMIRLHLDQQTLIAHQGHPLTVSGQLEILNPTQLQEDEAVSYADAGWQGWLQITLRDPQNSQVLVEVQQPIPQQNPTFIFSCALGIPENCKIRLMLGEVSVRDANSAEIATQSFTVTANIEDLLGALTQDPNLFNPPLESLLADPKPLDSSFLDLLETRKELPASGLQPSSNQPIPPQIYQPNPGVAAMKPPKLPTVRFQSLWQKMTVDGTAEENSNEGQAPVTYPAANLPPQIYRPSADQPTNKSPELPLFGGSPPTAESTDEPAETLPPAELTVNPVADAGDLMDNLLTRLAVNEHQKESLSDTAAIESQGQEEAAIEESAQSALEDDSAEASEACDSASPVETAFATLHLQERFWARLNALATDADSDWLQTEELAEGLELSNSEESPEAMAEGERAINDIQDGELVSGEWLVPQENETTDQPSLTADPSEAWPKMVSAEEPPSTQALVNAENKSAEPGARNPVGMPATPFSFAAFGNLIDQEIVVDDDPPEPEQRVSRGERSRLPNGRSYPSQSETSKSLEEEPLPAPELILPEGELTAGQSVGVRVKLPSVLPHIYVKLWIHDRQTRTLLDGPRWLVDFLPTGLGTLEIVTQLTVPFGSVEIRFEAVTVDTYTQRESHKVTVDRPVIPPDLPNWSLDDFGL